MLARCGGTERPLPDRLMGRDMAKLGRLRAVSSRGIRAVPLHRYPSHYGPIDLAQPRDDHGVLKLADRGVAGS